MPPIIRQPSIEVTLDGVVLHNVIGARGESVADSGWPTCSVFVTSKPGEAAEGQETDIAVVAGAGNNVTRFVGKVRRFRPSAFPKAIEIVCMGTLGYANEWAPDEDIIFDEVFPGGAADEDIIPWVLGRIPRVSYDTSNISGTGILLGSVAPEAFDWKAGTNAWVYVQKIDRATLFRTYQTAEGEIHRVRMIGHPNETPDFALFDSDVLDGATSSRDTERTRNYVRVLGHDYSDGLGPVQGEAAGANGFQGSGDVAATRHAEEFSSDLIESGVDPDDGSWDLNGGLRADHIAQQILLDVNKQFVEASVSTWRDDTHGPGMTCQLNMLERLLIGEPMWVVRYQWEISEDGWTATYGMTGGGLQQDYPTPPV